MASKIKREVQNCLFVISWRGEEEDWSIFGLALSIEEFLIGCAPVGASFHWKIEEVQALEDEAAICEIQNSPSGEYQRAHNQAIFEHIRNRWQYATQFLREEKWECVGCLSLIHI